MPILRFLSFFLEVKDARRLRPISIYFQTHIAVNKLATESSLGGS